MNHAENIKEMLSIPIGNRNAATSGYSSFTDSQLFFGSQFWPENSQSTSQDMSVSSRNSRQSSQEGSDPKFSSNYHTKPFLFGELNDKRECFGILDRFEEERKRAEEKTDSDILAKECNHFRETLNNIQQLVAGTERNTAVCQTVLEKFDNFASTLQNNLNSLQGDISQQFETLLNKVISQREMMTVLEEKVLKSGDTTAELGSNLQSLKISLECLRKEQESERNMLAEALKLLSTFISEHSANPSPERVTDSASQTSPQLEQPFCNVLQNNHLEDTQLICKSQILEHSQAGVPPQGPKYIIEKRRFSRRGRKMRKKRPLVPSQRSMHSVTKENRQPLMNCNKKQNVSAFECQDPNTVTIQDGLNPERKIRSVTDGYLITPLSCWSQDSDSSVGIPGIEPILEKLSAESVRETPVKAEDLWQLLNMDCDFDVGF